MEESEAVLPPVVGERGVAARLSSDPASLLSECAARYGDVFTVVLDEQHRMTYVLDPLMFQSLLTAPQVSFCPVSRQSKLRFGLEQLVATDEQVLGLSHTLIGALRGSRLARTLTRFDDALSGSLASYVASLHQAPRRTVQELTQQTLMPAAVHALFGAGIFDDRFVADFSAYSASVATRFAGSDPGLRKKGAAARCALMERLNTCLEHMDTPILAHISEHLFADRPVTHDDRLATLLMLMWGSMVNLVPTSAWMYASVIADAALIEELRRTGNTDDARSLRRSIVAETMRVYSRPNMYRAVVKDFNLTLSDGRTIRFAAGDWVALFPRALHHDPEVFEDAMRFDPRRFRGPENKQPQFYKAGAPLQHPTMIFGIGRGRCPGDAYSLAVLDRLLVAWTSALDAALTTPKLPDAVTDTIASTPAPDADIDVVLSASGYSHS